MDALSDHAAASAEAAALREKLRQAGSGRSTVEFQSTFRATKRADAVHGKTYEGAPYDVDESYFDHPLSPGSKVGHDQARHSRQKMLGEEWRAQRDATNPITGSDTRVDEWRAKKMARDPARAPDPVGAQIGPVCLSAPAIN